MLPSRFPESHSAIEPLSIYIILKNPQRWRIRTLFHRILQKLSSITPILLLWKNIEIFYQTVRYRHNPRRIFIYEHIDLCSMIHLAAQIFPLPVWRMQFYEIKSTKRPMRIPPCY